MSDSVSKKDIQELQTRYAFQEDLLNSLNHTVVEQARRIEQLERRCEHLQRVLQELADDVEQANQSPTHERPPHY